ncbi:unnamed protein product, partial [Staurois parvus]
ILHFRDLRRGRALLCLLPCQLGHTALNGCAQHNHPKQCAYSEAHRHHRTIKHTQHTVNPLITPHVNPFLSSAITTVSVLFFFF